MLVLARRVGERICIGNGIVITLVATSGDRARIGIEAPPVVSVDREEVRRRKEKELESPPAGATALVQRIPSVPVAYADVPHNSSST